MFLIFARPRSLSAWTANFLTQPPHSFCLHEGLADCGGDIRRLLVHARAHKVKHRGVAETALIHHVDKALEMSPPRETKYVVLTNAGDRWATWANANEVPEQVYDKINSDYLSAIKTLKPACKDRLLLIPSEALVEDEGIAEVLWQHVCAGAPFPIERWEMLRSLNVQTDLEKLRERILLSHSST